MPPSPPWMPLPPPSSPPPPGESHHSARYQRKGRTTEGGGGIVAAAAAAILHTASHLESTYQICMTDPHWKLPTDRPTQLFLIEMGDMCTSKINTLHARGNCTSASSSAAAAALAVRGLSTTIKVVRKSLLPAFSYLLLRCSTRMLTSWNEAGCGDKPSHHVQWLYLYTKANDHSSFTQSSQNERVYFTLRTRNVPISPSLLAYLDGHILLGSPLSYLHYVLPCLHAKLYICRYSLWGESTRD